MKLIRNVFLTGLYILYHIILGRKKLIKFQEEIWKDFIGKKIMEEFEKRNISLGLTFSREIKARCFFDQNKISITNKFIKEFLKEKIDPLYVWISLAHELGHLDQVDLHKEIYKKCKSFSCLYEEIKATQSGISFLERITGKEIEEIFTEDSLSTFNRSLFNQCQKCILLKILENECPKIKELEKLGILRKEENKKYILEFPYYFKKP